MCVMVLGLLIATLLSANIIIPSYAVAQDKKESYPSFQDWLLSELDKSPEKWDKLSDLIKPIRKRLAYDKKQNEVVILPHDIPDIALKPFSATVGEDPRLRPFVGSPTEPPRLRPFLSSGGMWNWITLSPFLPGHYDVTFEALTEQNGMPWSFAPQAAEVVADASRDPDLFEWKCPAAHAQNPLNTPSMHDSRSDRGKMGFFRWLKDRLTDIQEAQRMKDDRLALYQLGRALHSIQDLASHRGMDNWEHSWLDHQGQGPDEDTIVNIPLAKTLTKDFLDRVISKWPSINYDRLRNGSSELTTWGYFEIKSKLGFSRQLSKKEYDNYKQLGKDAPTSINGLSGYELETSLARLKNQWFSPDNWQGMMTEIRDYLVNPDSSGAAIINCS
jgi:hypothetical protein